MSRRRRALRVLAATASLLAFAPAARAMGGQDCAPETLAPVDAWLAKHPFLPGPGRFDQPAASACKTSSQDKRLTIVAVAYDAGQDDDKNLVVALVDTSHGSVHSFADLVVTDTADSHPARRTRTVMRYDGAIYRAPDREPWARTIEPEAAAARTP